MGALAENPFPGLRVAVIVPCFRVSRQVGGVLRRLPGWVDLVVVVDDCCPEASGDAARAALAGDGRLVVLRLPGNRGVGGAVVAGYREALRRGADILVKLDGDGQMDPALIERLVAPLAAGRADYAKGNRFFRVEGLGRMPRARLLGNAGLSFFSKLASGYWHLFDPNNGFTAIWAPVCALLPLDKIHGRYFFESDMLFRLNTLRAVVADVPMQACYGGEPSSLDLRRAAWEFPLRHLRNLGKRVFYNYFLRDFNFASLCLLAGLPLLVFGLVFGCAAWSRSAASGVPAHTGTIMLAALTFLLGVQFILSFFQYDMSARPVSPLVRDLRGPGAGAGERRTTVHAPGEQGP